jgi:hypothetical protein
MAAGNAEGTAAGSAMRTQFESPEKLTPEQAIDRLVLDKLHAKGITPSPVCNDAVFIRRVYFDVIGTLPTMDEVRRFLQDKNPKKRAVLIDELLARDEYADYWAMKWGDVLRVKSEYPINLWPNAAQGYYHWIRCSLAENVPYDRFARTLLTASGSNFYDPEVNFYRAVQSREPETLAKAVALTFMGARAEKWPKEKLEGLAGFFSQVGYKNTATWKEEIVFFDAFKTSALTSPRKSYTPVFPDGTAAAIPSDKDPREVFADWLIRADNPWFASNAANRVWYWLLGRGIVQEPDDVRPDNPPSNPELLAYLSQQLVDSRYDLKQLMRLILNSKTYQLSPIPPAGKSADAEALFACYPIHRLDAEVLIDALCQITGTNEEYSSLTPEPFTFIPGERRSITLPDGSITSPFLEMFGRPSRDSGLAVERNPGSNAQQCLHLINSSHIRNKIERGSKFWAMVKASGNPRTILENIYLTVLSRYPTTAEMEIVKSGFQPGSNQNRDLIIDVTWALINSSEFQYRH